MLSKVSLRSFSAFSISADFMAVSILLVPKFIPRPVSPKPSPTYSNVEATPPVTTIAPSEITPDAIAPVVPTAFAILQSFHTASSLSAAWWRLLMVCSILESIDFALAWNSSKSLLSCSFVTAGSSLILAVILFRLASISSIVLSVTWKLKVWWYMIFVKGTSVQQCFQATQWTIIDPWQIELCFITFLCNGYGTLRRTAAIIQQ